MQSIVLTRVCAVSGTYACISTIKKYVCTCIYMYTLYIYTTSVCSVHVHVHACVCVCTLDAGNTPSTSMQAAQLSDSRLKWRRN